MPPVHTDEADTCRILGGLESDIESMDKRLDGLSTDIKTVTSAYLATEVYAKTVETAFINLNLRLAEVNTNVKELAKSSQCLEKFAEVSSDIPARVDALEDIALKRESTVADIKTLTVSVEFLRRRYDAVLVACGILNVLILIAIWMLDRGLIHVGGQ